MRKSGVADRGRPTPTSLAWGLSWGHLGLDPPMAEEGMSANVIHQRAASC